VDLPDRIGPVQRTEAAGPASSWRASRASARAAGTGASGSGGGSRVSRSTAATPPASTSSAATIEAGDGRGSERWAGASKKTKPHSPQRAASAAAAVPHRGQLALVAGTAGL
jgi:hypothetical protein